MSVDLKPSLLIKGTPPQPVVELIGYLGPMAADGSVPLYFDLEFQVYCEIPAWKDHVVLSVPGADDGCPSKVYIKADAPLKLVHASKPGVAASFLKGEIVTSHLKSAARPARSIFDAIEMTANPYPCLPVFFGLCTEQPAPCSKACPTPTKQSLQ